MTRILKTGLLGLTLGVATIGLAAAADIDNPAGHAPPGLNGTAPGLQRHDSDRDNDRDYRGNRRNMNFQSRQMDRDHDRDDLKHRANFQGRQMDRDHDRDDLKNRANFQGRHMDRDHDRDLKGTNANFKDRGTVKTDRDNDHDRDDTNRGQTPTPAIHR
jgi:hypothetical protein